MLKSPIALEDSYVHLAANGDATTVAGGPSFWSLPREELDAYGEGWMVLEFVCSEDWPNWERHPGGDEVVVVQAGAVRFLFEFADGVRELALEAPATVVVPRGIWHTAKPSTPTRLLHITRGVGTESRPV